MQRILMSGVGAVFALSLSTAIADTKPIPETFTHDSTPCMFGTRRVEVQFAGENKTSSGEKGDPYVWLKPEGGNQVLAIRPVDEKAGRFALLDRQSPYSSCERTLTFRLPRGVSAILLRQLARPDQPESLAVVAWDADAQKVTAVRRDLGAFSEIESWDKGFKFSQNYRPFSPKPAKVQMLKSNRDVIEEQLKTWYVVSIQAGKVDSDFSRKQTFEMSPYKKFFITQKAFEKAFEWDAKTGDYAKRWVYLAKSPEETQPDCVQPSSKRSFKPEEKHWFCEPSED